MPANAVSSKEEVGEEAPETAFPWFPWRVIEETLWIEQDIFSWDWETMGAILCCRLDAGPADSPHTRNWITQPTEVWDPDSQGNGTVVKCSSNWAPD